MKNIKNVLLSALLVLYLCGCGKAPGNEYAQVMETAEEYLAFGGYSYSGLITALINREYTPEEAQYAADHCGADWNEEAVDAANAFTDRDAVIALYSSHDIVKMIGCSYPNLLNHLKAEGFSSEEAQFGAEHCDADWNELANLYARYRLNGKGISRLTLIADMSSEGFSEKQISYALENSEADWPHQAAICAANLYYEFHHNYEELCAELRMRGFTSDEAIYGAMTHHKITLPHQTLTNEETLNAIIIDEQYEYFPEYPVIPKPDSMLDIIERSNVKTYDNDTLTSYHYTYFNPIPGGIDMHEACNVYLEKLDELRFRVAEKTGAISAVEYHVFVGLDLYMTVSMHSMSDYDYFLLDMVPERAGLDGKQ